MVPLPSQLRVVLGFIEDQKFIQVYKYKERQTVNNEAITGLLYLTKAWGSHMRRGGGDNTPRKEAF